MRDKAKWHRCAVALLGRVARALDIPRDERTIRSNKGGNAVGGEVTMSAPIFGVYIHLACPWNSYGESELPFAANYARKASPDDPYGTRVEARNYMFQSLTGDEIVKLLKSIGGN